MTKNLKKACAAIVLIAILVFMGIHLFVREPDEPPVKKPTATSSPTQRPTLPPTPLPPDMTDDVNPADPTGQQDLPDATASAPPNSTATTTAPVTGSNIPRTPPPSTNTDIP